MGTAGSGRSGASFGVVWIAKSVRCTSWIKAGSDAAGTELWAACADTICAVRARMSSRCLESTKISSMMSQKFKGSGDIEVIRQSNAIMIFQCSRKTRTHILGFSPVLCGLGGVSRRYCFVRVPRMAKLFRSRHGGHRMKMVPGEGFEPPTF